MGPVLIHFLLLSQCGTLAMRNLGALELSALAGTRGPPNHDVAYSSSLSSISPCVLGMFVLQVCTYWLGEEREAFPLTFILNPSASKRSQENGLCCVLGRLAAHSKGLFLGTKTFEEFKYTVNNILPPLPVPPPPPLALPSSTPPPRGCHGWHALKLSPCTITLAPQ